MVIWSLLFLEVSLVACRCPDSYIRTQSLCLKLMSSSSMSHSDAKTACASDQPGIASLAILDTPDKLAEAWSLLKWHER